MNNVWEKILNESTIECMGVNQLNSRLFAESIIRECARIAGGVDGKIILNHFGLNKETN